MRFVLKAVVAIRGDVCFACRPGTGRRCRGSKLRTYIGNWSGSSVLQGGDKPETFSFGPR